MIPIDKRELLKRARQRLETRSELRVLLRSGRMANSPRRPLPFVFFSEIVLGLDCFRLSGDECFLRVVEDNVQDMLALEDGKQALHDEFRARPSAGWSCSYLYRWQRRPDGSESHEQKTTNDVTTSAIVGVAILLYYMQVLEARLSSASADTEIEDVLARVLHSALRRRDLARFSWRRM